MNVSFFNFLGSALVPVVEANVTTSSPGDIHLVLVSISALRTFPNQLAITIINNLNFSVPTTNLAIIALGVQFSVHDVIINKLHNAKNSRNIIGQVCDFNVTNSSTGGQLLESRLKFQLIKGVDMFGNVD